MGSLIVTLLKQKAAGKLVGLLASKTQYGATATALGGLMAVLPRALENDPEAVGQAALIIFGWLTVMYGRLKAKLEAPAKGRKKGA